MSTIAQELRQQGSEQGLQQGLQQGLITILETRFGPVSKALSERIGQTGDLARLQQLYQQAMTVGSLEAFEALLPAS